MEIASSLVMNANMFLIPSTVRGGRGLPCEATLNIKEIKPVKVESGYLAEKISFGSTFTPPI